MGWVPPSLRMLTIWDLAGLAMARLTLSPLACEIYKEHEDGMAVNQHYCLQQLLRRTKDMQDSATGKLNSRSNILQKEKKILIFIADFHNDPWWMHFQTLDLHNPCLHCHMHFWSIVSYTGISTFQKGEADSRQNVTQEEPCWITAWVHLAQHPVLHRGQLDVNWEACRCDRLANSSLLVPCKWCMGEDWRMDDVLPFYLYSN